MFLDFMGVDGIMRILIDKQSRQQGSVLLMLLVAVTILGLSAGIAGSTWKTITQRAKEEELLWRGGQFRAAIGSYYKGAHAGAPATFPQSIDDLLKDPRSLNNVRHLRRPYLDPMTGQDWILIKDPSGRIKGVKSSSTLRCFKKGNFKKENGAFAGKFRYDEWEFIFTPEKVKAKKESSSRKETNNTLNVEGNSD